MLFTPCVLAGSVSWIVQEASVANTCWSEPYGEEGTPLGEDTTGVARYRLLTPYYRAHCGARAFPSRTKSGRSVITISPAKR